MEIVRRNLSKIVPISKSKAIVVRRNEAPSIFTGVLRKQEEKILDTDRLELNEISKRLEEAGSRLEKEPTSANFRTFRDWMGAFAKMATSIAYRVENVAANYGQWTNEVVLTINREADALYHLVMHGQQNRVLIASKIADIRGMIVKLTA